MTTPLVRRTDHVLRPDPTRVVSLPFLPGEEIHGAGTSRRAAVLQRLLALPEPQVVHALDDVLASFGARHHDLPGLLDERYSLVAGDVDVAHPLTLGRRRLIGACMSQEYAVEAAALFNPSMVRHPDQGGLPAGTVRFVMSVRGVGEGHISCIELRTGSIGPDDEITFDRPGPLTTLPGRQPAEVGDAESAYAVSFPSASAMDSRVLLPGSAAERHGLEDLRLVPFTADDGTRTYLGTYTAFDGTSVAPHLLSTDDFTHVRMTPLTGAGAKNKGMALFPRPVGGRYLALSRWDRENNSIASSQDLQHWDDLGRLRSPDNAWEIVQAGNCGSPLETSAGWLVLTHGVGPMRVYGIGAMLLDLDDPRRIVGHLASPLLTPSADERDGYVPNVVYSCGAMVHGDTLVLPYGCSDAAIRVALVDLPRLLALLQGG